MLQTRDDTLFVHIGTTCDLASLHIHYEWNWNYYDWWNASSSVGQRDTCCLDVSPLALFARQNQVLPYSETWCTCGGTIRYRGLVGNRKNGIYLCIACTQSQGDKKAIALVHIQEVYAVHRQVNRVILSSAKLESNIAVAIPFPGSAWTPQTRSRWLVPGAADRVSIGIAATQRHKRSARLEFFVFACYHRPQDSWSRIVWALWTCVLGLRE